MERKRLSKRERRDVNTKYAITRVNINRRELIQCGNMRK